MGSFRYFRLIVSERGFLSFGIVVRILYLLFFDRVLSVISDSKLTIFFYTPSVAVYPSEQAVRPDLLQVTETTVCVFRVGSEEVYHHSNLCPSTYPLSRSPSVISVLLFWRWFLGLSTSMNCSDRQPTTYKMFFGFWPK